jgi:hypothetical protein
MQEDTPFDPFVCSRAKKLAKQRPVLKSRGRNSIIVYTPINYFSFIFCCVHGLILKKMAKKRFLLKIGRGGSICKKPGPGTEYFSYVVNTIPTL